ncbi:MAG: hypothetical protein Q9188_001799 [Gyalolechia gomerana]
MFLIWLIPCAVAQCIQTMLVARFQDGVVGSAFLSVAGGTIDDMFDRSDLQARVMIYSARVFDVVFEENHYFKLWQVGLTFAGLLVGIVIAAASDPLWHGDYVRLVQNRELNGGERGGAEPEYRLPPTIAGGILVPIGLFWHYDLPGANISAQAMQPGGSLDRANPVEPSRLIFPSTKKGSLH